MKICSRNPPPQTCTHFHAIFMILYVLQNASFPPSHFTELGGDGYVTAFLSTVVSWFSLPHTLETLLFIIHFIYKVIFENVSGKVIKKKLISRGFSNKEGKQLHLIQVKIIKVIRDTQCSKQVCCCVTKFV